MYVGYADSMGHTLKMLQLFENWDLHVIENFYTRNTSNATVEIDYDKIAV